MAGWFYTDELRYGQRMLGYRGASENEFYVIMLNNGALECRWLPNDKFYEIATTEFTILPEQWQHLALYMRAAQLNYILTVCRKVGQRLVVFSMMLRLIFY